MHAVRTWAAFGQMLRFPSVIPTAGWVLCSEIFVPTIFTLPWTIDLESSHMREGSAEDHSG